MMPQDHVISALNAQLANAQLPEARIDVLNRLGLFHRHINVDDTLAYAEQAHDLAVARDYACGIAEALTNMAYVNFVRGEIDLSLGQIAEALALAREHEALSAQVDALDLLANNEIQVGEYANALENLLEALRIAEELNDEQLLFNVLNDISRVYKACRHYEKALESYQGCLQHYVMHQDSLPSTLEYTIRHNLAVCYQELGQYDEALTRTQENLAWYRETDTIFGQILTLGCAGETYLALGRLDEAKHCFDDVLGLAREYGDKEVEIETLIDLGDYYLALGQAEQALRYMRKAEALLDRTSVYRLQGRLHGLFSQAYQHCGNFEAALDHALQHHATDKALLTMIADQRLKAMQVFYETESAQKEVEIYRLRNEVVQQVLAERERVNAERLERERLQIALEKEHEFGLMKTGIMERLSHEMRTPLATIQTQAALLTRYADRLTPDKRTVSEQIIVGQISRLTTILDDIILILRGPDDPRGFRPQTVALADILPQIMGRLTVQLKQPERIMTEFDSATGVVALDDVLIERILKELLTNALKFSPGASPVTVTGHVVGNDIILKVSDQGIGILVDEQGSVFKPFFRGSNFDETPGIGLGMTLVDQWVQLHQGRVLLESQPGKGTIITLFLPGLE